MYIICSHKERPTKNYSGKNKQKDIDLAVQKISDLKNNYNDDFLLVTTKY